MRFYSVHGIVLFVSSSPVLKLVSSLHMYMYMTLPFEDQYRQRALTHAFSRFSLKVVYCPLAEPSYKLRHTCTLNKLWNTVAFERQYFLRGKKLSLTTFCTWKDNSYSRSSTYFSQNIILVHQHFNQNLSRKTVCFVQMLYNAAFNLQNKQGRFSRQHFRLDEITSTREW